VTVVVAVNAPGRVRGFLASCMLEIAPGVYTAPEMSAGVRERVWAVLTSWWEEWPEASIVMTWRAPSQPGGQGVLSLGEPPCELVPTESVTLVRRELRDPPTLD
jgi:CRISPR-associated protein Cas2